MKVVEAKFNSRYKTAEYEFEDYTLAAILEDTDSPIEALVCLKMQVQAAFSGEETVQDPEEQEVQEEKPAKVTATASKGKKAAASKPKDPEPEEVAEEDEEEPVDHEEEEVEAEEEEVEPEEEVEEKKPATASKKTFKKKPQIYTRSSEQHKEIFSTVLKAVAPDWKKTPESKEKAKAVSQKMEGKEFLDESGEVLESFKAEIKKQMLPSAKKK